MVEFVTLFLGLISGLQIVEVSVTEDVAAVELWLDGAMVVELTKEPWRAEVDFGKVLRPRIFEAVARDRQGGEVHRSRQVLNLAQSSFMLRISLGRPRTDGTRDGRLVWLSSDNQKPREVTVTLDGKPLDVVARRAFKLPFDELRPEVVRIVSAQADFGKGQLANATVVLGGQFGEDVTSQLTAVPVVVAPGQELPATEQLDGWLTKNGEPLDVVAVEEQAGQAIVVRDRDSLGTLVVLGSRFRQARHQAVGTLGAQRAIRILRATPLRETQGESDQWIDKFSISKPFSEGHGGVPTVLASMFFRGTVRSDGPVATSEPQRLATAVAQAGLAAANSGLIRAVVLIVGENPADESRWQPATVRDFLHSLRVPLHVWSTISDTRRQRLEGWEPIEDISTHGEYLQAIGRLKTTLDSQRVFWVRGVHFVNEIQVAPQVTAARTVQSIPQPVTQTAEGPR